MELPKPPEDPDLKNIIDKLANFVARNGPQFEHMTKDKQRDNPRFSFLFGGEHFNYYQCKVTTEQAIINQQKQKHVSQQNMAQPVPTVPWQHSPLGQPPPLQAPPPQVVVSVPTSQPVMNKSVQLSDQLQEQLDQQAKTVAEQVKNSEFNLSAQYASLMNQRQNQIEDGMKKALDDRLMELSLECKLPLRELDQMAQPIIESCTKDAISQGKNWVFNHTSAAHCELIAQYVMRRIISRDASFELRLHLIYLINDILHHCKRKNAEDLRLAIQRIVIPAFCTAHQGASEEKQQKLNKLMALWHQNSYFDEDIIDELRDSSQALANYQNERLANHSSLVNQITTDTNERYASLQKQHQLFVNHLNNQVKTLEQQLQQHQQQQLLQQVISPSAPGSSPMVIPVSAPPGMPTPPPTGLPSQVTLTQGPPQGPPPVMSNQPPPGFAKPAPSGAVNPNQPPPGFPPPDLSLPPPNFHQPPPGFSPFPGPTTPRQAPIVQEYNHGQASHTPPPAPIIQDYNHGQPPTSQAGAPVPLPDLSKPPPGFPPPTPSGNSLPPPPALAPHTEADLTPSVPYFELPAGLMAPLVKLEDCEYKALDPQDIRLPPPQAPSERLLAAVEAFYSPPSHERPRDSEGWEKLGLFEYFKVKEKAKKIKQDSLTKKPRARSRSPTHRKRTPSPDYKRASPPRSRSRSKSRSRSRSRSRSPSPPPAQPPPPPPPPPVSRSKERSPSPPSFFPSPYEVSTTDTKLGADNKGHQLLMKMGWGGGGLGSSEQGIVDPVAHAEVRDRTDMHKGIGISMADPFEQFRKSKSQGFIQRMKEAALNK